MKQWNARGNWEWVSCFGIQRGRGVSRNFRSRLFLHSSEEFLRSLLHSSSFASSVTHSLACCFSRTETLLKLRVLRGSLLDLLHPHSNSCYCSFYHLFHNPILPLYTLFWCIASTLLYNYFSR